MVATLTIFGSKTQDASLLSAVEILKAATASFALCGVIWSFFFGRRIAEVSLPRAGFMGGVRIGRIGRHRTERKERQGSRMPKKKTKGLWIPHEFFLSCFHPSLVSF